jgi:hypothetical protein
MVRRFFTVRQGASAAENAAGTGTHRTRRRRPALEALEQRALLSFAGSLRQLSARYGDSYAPTNASSASGTSVAAWIKSNLSTSVRVYGPIEN